MFMFSQSFSSFSQGNAYFKQGDYENAIECYTKGADLDPTNPLLPANRAMALLKQEKLVLTLKSDHFINASCILLYHTYR